MAKYDLLETGGGSPGTAELKKAGASPASAPAPVLTAEPASKSLGFKPAAAASVGGYKTKHDIQRERSAAIIAERINFHNTYTVAAQGGMYL